MLRCDDETMAMELAAAALGPQGRGGGGGAPGACAAGADIGGSVALGCGLEAWRFSAAWIHEDAMGSGAAARPAVLCDHNVDNKDSDAAAAVGAACAASDDDIDDDW